MNTLNLEEMNLTSLTASEYVSIEGGDYNSGYSAGQAAGQLVRKVVDGVGALKFIWDLL
ncbi:hypothetical protein [Mucilaginibacter sp. KACC 22063]|uniref:hypothetical protein n=1 Tax=Mucilaginibacter sp. KACC 22063 TaxID=3025666 RepID=UPI0023663C63|nr:hypothetical protein [Mucilaginibacter sp. KACC 22063]WDF54878.1 hypothetical protein PQ461_18270 [Mucilaginibacter sp. KACC 22063]